MATATATYFPETFRDGYSTIGKTSNKASQPTSIMAESTSTQTSAGERMQAMARGAGAAAVGAKDAVVELIAAPMPEVNLYTEPLNPGAQLTLRDRLQLVLESCRPWQVFLDPRGFGRPVASELKLRIGHNLEIFFYNYLVVAVGLLTLFAIFHPIRAVLLVVTVVVGMLFYIIFPEDYVVTENFSVTKRMKHVLMAVLALLVLTVGNVFSMLFWVTLIFVPFCLIHASFREHSPAVQTAI